MNTRKVYKYEIKIRDDLQELLIPSGAQLLHVDEQEGDWANAKIELWALVDPESPFTTRRFRVYGTGHPIRDVDMAYVGTAQHRTTGLVWHVFEKVNP